MSFRDRHGFQREAEIYGSHSSSHDQYDIERNGGERFRVSTPTRPSPIIFNSSEPLLPRNNNNSMFDTNTSMEYNGGYHYVSHAQQRPDTSVLLSDEVISGSLTNGTRMS